MLVVKNGGLDMNRQSNEIGSENKTMDTGKADARFPLWTFPYCEIGFMTSPCKDIMEDQSFITK